MEVNYLPLKDRNSYGCFEHAYISILNTYYNKYEMVNKYAFRIQMNPKVFKSFNVDLLQIDSQIPQLISDYYGLEFKLNSNDMIELIQKELELGKLCIINLDLFWDSFRKDYYHQIHTDYHARVVSGKAERSFVMYNWDERYILEEDDLNNGCLEVITYEEREKSKGLIFENLINVAIQDMENFFKENIVYQYKKIDEAIIDFNLYEEIEVHKSLLGFPFFENCRTLARSRGRFKDYVSYLLCISKKENVGINSRTIIEIIDVLAEMEKVWWGISNGLIKGSQIIERKGYYNNKEMCERIKKKVDILKGLDDRLYCLVNELESQFSL